MTIQRANMLSQNTPLSPANSRRSHNITTNKQAGCDHASELSRACCELGKGGERLCEQESSHAEDGEEDVVVVCGRCFGIVHITMAID